MFSRSGSTTLLFYLPPIEFCHEALRVKGLQPGQHTSTSDISSIHVAIVGLGAGSMTCYVRPPQQLTYYEIDPAVERIAQDPRYFTFLRDCNPNVRVVLGDARISLKAAPDHYYGLIVIDAFSGDSIPAHLLTREALQLYLKKLEPNGILVFHISNNYLDLQPVVASLARDAGLICLIERDTYISEAQAKNGVNAGAKIDRVTP